MDTYKNSRGGGGRAVGRGRGGGRGGNNCRGGRGGFNNRDGGRGGSRGGARGGFNNRDGRGRGRGRGNGNNFGGRGRSNQYNNNNNNKYQNDGDDQYQQGDGEDGPSFYQDRKGNRNNNNNNNSFNNRSRNNYNNNYHEDSYQDRGGRKGGDDDDDGNDNEDYYKPIPSSKKDDKNTVEADPSTRQYFERIKNVLKETEDEEEKSIIIDNALKELGSNAHVTLCDKSCSLVFEYLIKSFTNTQRVNLLKSMNTNYMMVVTNCNGSRLIETILNYTPTILNDTDSDNIQSLIDTIFALFDTLIDNIKQVSHDNYATYVFSAVISLLTGKIKEKKEPTKYQKSNDIITEESQTLIYDVPNSFGEKLKVGLQSIFDKLKDNIAVMVYDSSYTLNVLKTLFTVAKDNQSYFTKLTNKILSPSEEGQTEEDKLINLSNNQFGSILLETIIQNAPNTIYMKLFTMFKNNILILSEHSFGNHVIQKLVENIRDASQIKSMVQVIKENDTCKRLFEIGKAYIIQKVVEGCIKFDTQQKDVLKILIATVIPKDQENYRQMIHNLLVLENNISRRHNFSTSGALIVQNLFNFNSNFNSGIIDGFLSMENEQIKTLITDLVGSRVIDGFLNSSIPMAKKQQLIQSLKGSFVDIALDKYGSYVIEKIYNISDMTVRESICEELAAQEEKVFSKPCGRYVLLVCKVNVYKKKKSSWSQQQSTQDKKRKMFDEIINDDGKLNEQNQNNNQKNNNKNNNNNNNNGKYNNNNKKKNDSSIPTKHDNDKKTLKKQKGSNSNSASSGGGGGDMFDEIDEIFSKKK